MANIEKLIPHILLWENSIKQLPGETLRDTFKRAAKDGVIVKATDKGGPTFVGVTLKTFKDWRRRQGKPTPTQADLGRLGYEEWVALLKSLFWDKCRGDEIRSQSVANMFVDWVWNAGGNGIRATQTAFSLVADGIVGPKTLAALNGKPAMETFYRIKFAREAYYRRLASQSPTQAANLNGWLNRTNGIAFEG